MKAYASPKLGAYAGLSAFALLAALTLRRPELAVLATPFALLAGLALALARRPDVRVAASLDRERVLQGEEVTATIELEAPEGAARLDVVLVVPPGLAVVDGETAFGTRLDPGRPHVRELRLRCNRWGGYVLGDVLLRARDAFGFFVWESSAQEPLPLRVYPRQEHLRSLLAPLETQVFAGNQVSRAKGEGIEFADLRPFVPGDRVRRINWRASARRGGLWVNERHPERNTDVILFLDTFTEARRAGGDGTLNLAVRAAASLAARYLERKDRVGLVSFGGVLGWLLPATGLVHLYRVLDALIGTEITLNYAWKDVDVIPRGTLPPQALVLALTPLLDDRAITTLLDLRTRGFDLAVVEVAPEPFAPPGPSSAEQLAHRLWLAERDALRARYLQAGVPVAHWREHDPLAVALEEVTVFRRHARPARA